ncbi:MAG: zinc-binding dehydrogenase [bacterium]|jgi:threonine 3-dehydrogenase
MAGMMKALQKTRLEVGGEIKEIAIPEVKPGFVLVKIELAAICGSDLQVYNWRADVAKKVRLPLTMGHEYCGTVVALGDHVQNVAVGDRVAGETHYPCGKCYMCATGNQHICVDMKIVGRSYPGCFAQYMLAPEICVRKVPQDLDPKLAAIFEPLGVAVHALQRTNPCGETVAVLGCGPIGLIAVAAAKKMGAARVFAISRTKEKLDLAQRLGAVCTFNSKEVDVVEAIKEVTKGAGVDVVLEVSGSNEAFIQGLEMLKNQGRFCLIGIPTKPVEFNSDRYLIRKGLSITGIWGRRMFDTWLAIEELLASGELDLTPLLGNVYSLDDFAAAFQEAASGTPQRIFLAP